MKMPNIGSIYELRIPTGLAYLQFVGEVKNHGPLFRVLNGIYKQPLEETDLERIVKLQHQFYTIFPFVGARRQKYARLMTTIPVPASFSDLPPLINDQRDLTGAFHIIFSTGQPSLVVKELTEEQKDYPEAGVPAADLLGGRIASGWRPRDWYERRRWK